MVLIVNIVSIIDNLKMNKEYLQKFAKHLKKLRKEKGLVQDDFANLENISRSTLGMVETGKTDITLSKIKIIADRLGVHPKDLLDFD